MSMSAIVGRHRLTGRTGGSTERHILTTAAGESVATHHFVMQGWTREELEASLRGAGFDALEYAATYDGAPTAAGDRLVAVATRGAGTERRA